MHDRTEALKLLGPPKTKGYRPSVHHSLAFASIDRLPHFDWIYIEIMLRDPRIRLALRTIKGPLLSNARFKINTDNKAVKEFIATNLTRFWRTHAIRALTGIEWGFSGSEVLYKYNEETQLVDFDALKVLHANDVRVATKDGNKAAIKVRNLRDSKIGNQMYLHGPKGFWFVHGRDKNPWYGVPRVVGAYAPWWDSRGDGGSVDSLRLYFYKYALGALDIRYPPGIASDGTKTNAELAADIATQLRNGGVVAIPNERNDQGHPLWEIETIQFNQAGGEMVEYDKHLDRKKAEGMGIPNEVLEAQESGSGFAGRRVPATAFFSMLQEIVNDLAGDFTNQVLEELVNLNFGRQESFEVIPLPLMRDTEEDDKEKMTPAPQPAPFAQQQPMTQQQAPQLQQGTP